MRARRPAPAAADRLRLPAARHGGRAVPDASTCRRRRAASASTSSATSQAGTRAKVVDDAEAGRGDPRSSPQETREKEILSLTGTGRVREFQLRYRVGFRVHDGKGARLRAGEHDRAARATSPSTTPTMLAKETEEAAAVPRHAERHGAADHAAPGRRAKAGAAGPVSAAARRAARRPAREDRCAGLRDPRRRAAARAGSRRRGARRGAQARLHRARGARARARLRLERVRARRRRACRCSAEKKIVELRLAIGQARRAGRRRRSSPSASGPAEDLLLLVSLPRRTARRRSAAWFGALGRAGVMVDVLAGRARARCRRGSRQRLARQQQSAPREVLEFLADRVEGNLLAAHQEMQKLALLAPRAS